MTLPQEVLEQTEQRLCFDVKLCRYAEMYKALDIPELGALFSCNRDFAPVEGFNNKTSLTRTQTIMAGSSHRDFGYAFPKQDKHQ
ncbi:MAG: L-2-amino-thiazoline-4-carboxylic acid hydrolase [Desulfatiglandales bacterium]